MSARVVFHPDGSAELSFTYKKWVIDQIKEIPAGDRSFDPSTKSWSVSPEWALDAINILKSAFEDVEIVKPGARRPEPTPIRPLDAYADLYLLPTAPPAVVQAVYRVLAMQHHPDKGGSTAAMQKINGAFEQLKARGAA